MNTGDRFNKFTERAQRVLRLAQEEAQRLQHNYIGTEHLLLGLVSEGEGLAAVVLQELGIELERIRKAVEFLIGREDCIVLGEIGLTPRAKKVIELSVDEARRLGHHYIGTEHILLGLVREGEGIAAGVLQSMGVNLQRVRAETMRVLWQHEHPGVEAIPEVFESARTGSKPDVKHMDFKLTEDAQKVLDFAQEEALHFRHGYVGTEHILLGIVREGDSRAAHVLKTLGVDFIRARGMVYTLIGQGERMTTAKVDLTPRAKELLQLAQLEAEAHRQSSMIFPRQPIISPEHLLLGLAHISEGIAVSTLGSLGIDLGILRKKTLQAMQIQENQ